MYLRKIVWIVACLGLVGAGIVAYFVYNALFAPNTRFAEDKAYVYIPSDAHFGQVCDTLAPLLEDMSTFRAVAGRKQYPDNIRAGKYEIRRGMNNNEIVNSLRSGNIPVNISFNNQESLPELAGRIASQIEPDSLTLVRTLQDSAYLREYGLDEYTGIALYIPNTYEFFWNTSAMGFRERMMQEYERFWNPDRLEKAESLGLKPLEVISLASVVQKETARVDERPRVAGVYLNRLKNRMLLQADPTVIYAIKKETGNFDTVIRRVLYRDLELDSPYNTYRYAGIPPGPITMPDISSVDAVLNAESHQYLYFVADVTNFGYHKFAESLQQHNRNKAQYIRWLNEQEIKR